MILYRRILFLFSLIITIIILSTISTVSGYGLWYTIPMFYAVLYYLFIPKNIIIGPGFIVSNVVLFARYELYPLFLMLFGLPNGSQVQYWSTAVNLMLIEIVVILLAFRFFCIKNEKQLPRLSPQNHISTFVVLVLIVVYFALIVFVPDVFANRHFILNDSYISEVLILSKAGRIGVVIKWLEYFLILLILNNVYVKKQSYFLCLLVLIIPRLFYEGHSRLSILTPLIVAIFLLISLFPGKKKTTILFGTTIIVFSMTLLTMTKVYRTDSIRNLVVENPQHDLNAYFGGINNVAIGIACYETNKDVINSNVMINDMFRNMLVFNQFFNSSNSSPAIYNGYIYGKASETEDQIVPTICQGLFYFGYSLFWVLSVIMVFVTCYADKKFYKSKNIASSWLYGMMGVTVGWAIPGSFQHLYMCIYYTFIPMWIIFTATNSLTKWNSSPKLSL